VHTTPQDKGISQTYSLSSESAWTVFVTDAVMQGAMSKDHSHAAIPYAAKLKHKI
jgi:hypothetical protein